MPWSLVEPVFSPDVRRLCTRSYPGHPRGCPNHGKRPSCPPEAPLLPKTLDLSREVWVVWNDFDVGEHADRMRRKHPGWSDRQLYCCLYWQGTARAQLRGEIDWAIRYGAKSSGLTVLQCPEASGVNVTGTMASLGIVLEWPPKQIARQVALMGYPTRRRKGVRRC